MRCFWVLTIFFVAGWTAQGYCRDELVFDQATGNWTYESKGNIDPSKGISGEALTYDNASKQWFFSGPRNLEQSVNESGRELYYDRTSGRYIYGQRIVPKTANPRSIQNEQEKVQAPANSPSSSSGDSSEGMSQSAE